MHKIKASAMTFLRKWILLIQRGRYVVVTLFLVLATAAFNFTINNLGMNTDTRDMLSPDLLWRQLDLQYEQDFPVHTNNILAVIEAPTPDQAADAAGLLYSRLLQEPDLFKTVFYPNGLVFFKKSGLLYLDIGALQDLSDNLAEIQPFLGRLTEDQTIRGLFAMLADAVDAMADGDDIDISKLLDEINLALFAAQRRQNYQVSWQKLMHAEGDSASVYREFIVLQPVLDYSSLLPGEKAIDRLQQLAEELGLSADLGAKLRLTGSVVLAHEELLSVTRGMEIAVVLAFLMVALIMLFGLGSARLVSATLITLVTGLILTAAFAAFAVGDLNLISVAFAVLYIGLGVDFAIHFCLRYRELRIAGMVNTAAIAETSINVGRSLFLCAVTTSIGFYAFIPTDYLGVGELGLISGTGMFISLLVTLTLLPALMAIFPYRPSDRVLQHTMSAAIRNILAIPLKHPGRITIISLVLLPVCAWFSLQASFDPNTLNLQDPDNESVKTYQDLLAESDTSPWTGTVLADSRIEAKALSDKLEKLPLVEDTVWIDDFIPANQDEKLMLIEEMNLLLGSLPAASDSPQISHEDRMAVLTSFMEKLDKHDFIQDHRKFRQLHHNLRDYLEYLSIFSDKQQSNELLNLEQSLIKSLPGRIDTLRQSLDADYVSPDDLPVDLEQRWHNNADKFLIEIYPRHNIEDNTALRNFVEQLQAAEPRVIGSPVLSIEAGDAVVSAFQSAFLYAFIVITLLLFVLLKHRKDTFYILTALAMAAVFTTGISALLSIPFNFANIIALPLLLGIGVDSGIHILHRYHSALPDDHSLLATSSARAVFVSGLTTMVSIGNLAFSSHQGTASMGKILAIGILMTLLCMLIILPGLIYAGKQKQQNITDIQ
jgi:hypothetical protein